MWWLHAKLVCITSITHGMRRSLRGIKREAAAARVVRQLRTQLLQLISLRFLQQSLNTCCTLAPACTGHIGRSLQLSRPGSPGSMHDGLSISRAGQWLQHRRSVRLTPRLHRPSSQPLPTHYEDAV